MKSKSSMTLTAISDSLSWFFTVTPFPAVNPINERVKRMTPEMKMDSPLIMCPLIICPITGGKNESNAGNPCLLFAWRGLKE